MTPEEFVELLRQAVLDRAVDSTISLVESPPGRRPKRELAEANAWYEELSDSDRAQLRVVAAMVAQQVAFGFLAVLDGSRVVETTPEKGTFKLTFQKGDSVWELNSPTGVPLHDLLNLGPSSSTT